MDVKESWLQDKDGNALAPNTLVEAIYDTNGTPLKDMVVMPNPEGEATVELKKIKIGDTIFSLPEGGASYEAIETTEDTF